MRAGANGGTWGGGFDPAFGGVDYSQANAPLINRSDATTSAASAVLTIPGTGTTFPSDIVGNTVSITILGGYVGTFQITAWTSATQVTLDRNVGSSSAGAATIAAGGAMSLGNSSFFWSPVAGNKVWIRAGTYLVSVSAVSPVNGTVLQPLVIEGYNTTRGDITLDPTLQRPVLQWSASGIPVYTFGGTAQIVRAVEFNGTGTIFAAVTFNASAVNCVLENCVVKADNNSATIDVQGTRNTVRFCYIQAGTTNSDGILCRGNGGHTVFGNHIRSTAAGANNGTGILADVGVATIRNNSIQKMLHGIQASNGTLVEGQIESNALHRCTNGIVSSNAGEGIAAFPAIRNNIFSRLTRGIYYTIADISGNAGAILWAQSCFDCNYFYSCTNNYVNLPAGHGDTTLTADPFTNEGTFDFSLNNTTGGGATVRAGLCTTILPDAINRISLTAGPAGQPSAATPSGNAALLSIWREYTNEDDTDVITDDTIAIYNDAALQALNRRIGYHLTTTSSAITFVAETQEYDIPTDCVEFVWVEWNGREVAKQDIEEWRRDGTDWRNERSGEPRAWATYGNKIVFFPKPSAEAVARQASPIVRYISRPPSFTTAGFEQLNEQDHRVVIYLSVAEFSGAHPDSQVAIERAKSFTDRFETEAALIAEEYQRRAIAR